MCRTGFYSVICTLNHVFCFSGTHKGVISVAALVAILLFAIMIGSLWILYKRNSMCMRRFPSFGSAYYRQMNSQASDQDENVLLPELETQAGD